MGGDEQRGIRPVQGGDHWATTDHEPLISSRSRRPGETGDGQPGSQMEWQIYKLQVASGTVTEPAEQQSFQHWVASRVHRVLLNGFFHTTKARLVPFQGTGHRAQGTGHPPTTPRILFSCARTCCGRLQLQLEAWTAQLASRPNQHHQTECITSLATELQTSSPSQQNQPGFLLPSLQRY